MARKVDVIEESNGDLKLGNKDFYRQGDYTPFVTGGDAIINRASYVRVGNLVTIFIYIYFPSGRSAGSQLKVGLPFEIDSTSGTSSGVGFHRTNTGGYNYCPRGYSSTELGFLGGKDDGSDWKWFDGSMASGANIDFQFTYTAVPGS